MKLFQLNIQSMIDLMHKHPQHPVKYLWAIALGTEKSESNSKFYLTSFFLVAEKLSFLVTNSQQLPFGFGFSEQNRIQRKKISNPRRMRPKNSRRITKHPTAITKVNMKESKPERTANKNRSSIQLFYFFRCDKAPL